LNHRDEYVTAAKQHEAHTSKGDEDVEQQAGLKTGERRDHRRRGVEEKHAQLAAVGLLFLRRFLTDGFAFRCRSGRLTKPPEAEDTGAQNDTECAEKTA